MKRQYCVTIEETLSKDVYVMAESEEQALAIVEDKYKDEEIILMPETLVQTNFDVRN